MYKHTRKKEAVKGLNKDIRSLTNDIAYSKKGKKEKDGGDGINLIMRYNLVKPK